MTQPDPRRFRTTQPASAGASPARSGLDRASALDRAGHPSGPARERLELVAQLAGGLAHEIKNPLSTMKLNLQLLLEDWQDHADTELERRTVHKLEVLEDEVSRLEAILEDFLGFARAPELDLTLGDVGKLIQEVADFVEPELANARILLRSGARSGSLPLILFDRAKLKQALLNLIINARQAMAEHGGGELFLIYWRDQRPNLTGRTDAPAAVDEVVIEVTDTGPGIPAERRDEIFDVYFSTKQGGTGLGLPTVKRIVEEHGGRITLSSEVGRGTQFLVHLPVSRDPAR